ncbi:MAG: hypothetical protein ACFFB5_08140 [Promethearchaeota archaeon]
MAGLSNDIKDTIKFESLLMDILRPNINEQHARILAMMFKLGGYTTLNVLTKKLTMAQPTVSNRVAELVELGGFLRKNSELMPIALVLLLTVDELELLLRNKIIAYREACQFLVQLSDISDSELGKYTFIQAIDKLYPKSTSYQSYLVQLIANTYLHSPVSRNRLFQQVRSNLGESKKLEKELSSIIASHDDIFHIIHQKQQIKEMFVQPKLPLRIFAQNRLNYLESLFSYYQELLIELSDLMSSDYDSITPHKSLHYPSEIKRRLNRCLNHYSTIRVIDNSVYQERDDTNGILELLFESKNFTQDHKVMILTKKRVLVPDNINSSQITVRPLSKQISRDYITRDFIIFEKHGCLVCPSASSDPYYNISPHFISEILNTFHSIWRKKHVD